jgi:hypothetical protein
MTYTGARHDQILGLRELILQGYDNPPHLLNDISRTFLLLCMMYCT